MVSFANTERPLKLSEIQNVELKTRLKFPKEYTDHLLKYNGGYCHPDVFTFEEDGRLTHSGIDWFLAIYEGKFHNLLWYIETYKLEEKRLPVNMLPIAHDPGGNLICISCGEADYGYIYFWDHENEVDYRVSDDSDYSNLYFVSYSLSDFFKSLITIEDLE